MSFGLVSKQCLFVRYDDHNPAHLLSDDVVI
jgi:hypothetical protein